MSRKRRKQSLRSELEKDMFEVIGRLVGGLEVPLKAFCCKVRGGGGRLRHAGKARGKLGILSIMVTANL